jgi:hypothetical protein
MFLGKEIQYRCYRQKKEEGNHETQNAIRLNQFGVGNDSTGSGSTQFRPTHTRSCPHGMEDSFVGLMPLEEK